MHPTIKAHFNSSQQFWQAYFDDGERAGIFLENLLQHHVGQEIQLEIVFLDSDAHFKMLGQIIWRRFKKRFFKKYGIGSGIAFQAQELNKLKRIFSYIKGRTVQFPNNMRTDKMELTVKYPSQSAFVTDMIRGAEFQRIRITANEKLVKHIAQDQIIALKLVVPDRFLPIALQAQVFRINDDYILFTILFRNISQKARLKRLTHTMGKKIRIQLQK